MRKSFVFYDSFREAIYGLPEDMQLRIFRAICDYALESTLPSMNSVEGAIFTLIRPQLDASNNRYDSCVTNGKKGGRPSKKPKENPEKPKDNLNYNDNENLNDKYNVNHNQNDNGGAFALSKAKDNSVLSRAEEAEEAEEAFEDALEMSERAANSLEEFWTSYPKKIGRGEVEKWFASKSKSSSFDFDLVIAGLNNHLASKQWAEDDERFIPLPINWLIKQRWKDSLPPLASFSNTAPSTYSPTTARSTKITEADYEELILAQLKSGW